MDDRDTPVDEGLRALYGGLPAETPPAALDAAILSASREAVAVRRVECPDLVGQEACCERIAAQHDDSQFPRC